jgi:hypothetical protein
MTTRQKINKYTTPICASKVDDLVKSGRALGGTRNTVECSKLAQDEEYEIV